MKTPFPILIRFIAYPMCMIMFFMAPGLSTNSTDLVIRIGLTFMSLYGALEFSDWVED